MYCSCCMLLLALILVLEYASSWVCVYTSYLAALELGVKELSFNKQSWCNCLGLKGSAVALCQSHCSVLIPHAKAEKLQKFPKYQKLPKNSSTVGKRMEKAERVAKACESQEAAKVAKAKAANAAKAKTE